MGFLGGVSRFLAVKQAQNETYKLALISRKDRPGVPNCIVMLDRFPSTDRSAFPGVALMVVSIFDANIPSSLKSSFCATRRMSSFGMSSLAAVFLVRKIALNLFQNVH